VMMDAFKAWCEANMELAIDRMAPAPASGPRSSARVPSARQGGSPNSGRA